MSIVIAIILVTLTGLLCSVMLVVASHFMMVPTNEKEEKLRNCLPGANCGACGYTGCDSYAKALAEDATVKTNLCVPGADKVAKELAEVLGVKALDVVEKVAFIHCFGDCTKRTKKNNRYSCRQRRISTSSGTRKYICNSRQFRTKSNK